MGGGAGDGTIRLVYRSLLRVSKELDKELRRGRQHVAAREVQTIENVAGVKGLTTVAEGATSSGEIVRLAFKHKNMRTAGDWDVDAAFRTLKLVNQRLPVLRKLVYKPWSDTTTNGVRVKVTSYFLGPDVLGYKFGYNVRVANETSDPVMLVNREWNILDSDGRQNVVRGPGVAGMKPVIRPGSTFEYISGTPLRTDVGTMWGKYEMVFENKNKVFDVTIAPFALNVPLQGQEPGDGRGKAEEAAEDSSSQTKKDVEKE